MKPCLGCGSPTHGSRCRACKTERDKATDRLQRSYRWRKLSARLRRLSSVCEICDRPATDDDPLAVDHVVPLSVDPSREFDLTNLRLSHRSCNSRVYAQQVRAGVAPIADFAEQTLPRQQASYTPGLEGS